MTLITTWVGAHVQQVVAVTPNPLGLSATAARDEIYCRRHLLPHFGSMRLAAITPLDVSAFVAKMSTTRAPRTVQKAHQLLSAALESAVRLGYIAKNRARGTELPKADTQEMRFLNSQEIEQLVTVTAPRYRVLILTAAFTGLRWGELAGLEIKHLNLLRGSSAWSRR